MTPTRRSMLLGAASLPLAMAVPALAADKLVIGSYPANPPWEYKTETGAFEGFEVDMVKDIAKRLGMEPEIADYGFQALFAATSSSRIDLAISSISITPERLKSQSFTQGFYDSDLALVSRADSRVKSLADAKGMPVGAISTSTGEAWIKANGAQYGFGEYRGYNAQQDLLLDLQAGRIASAVGDIAGFQFAFVKLKDLAVVERIKTGDTFGVMMRKNHPLLGKVNDTLSAMKKDGAMAAIHKKWLGVAPRSDVLHRGG